MKKIILAISLFFSIQSFSQGHIDTVNVQNLTLKAGDWAYLVSFIDAKDSTIIAFVRKVRTAAQALQNPTWNTNMTVSNIRGVEVLEMYRTVTSRQIGMSEAIGSNIVNKIRAINNAALLYHIGQIDATYNSQYLQRRSIGKNILLDN